MTPMISTFLPFPPGEEGDYLDPLSLFRFRDGRPRPWGVTVDDCDPFTGTSSVVTFATRNEAQAFVLAEQRRESATGPL